MNDRLKRIEDFNKFKVEAKEIFQAISEKDESHKQLDDLFSLCICPGGRMGGVNEKIIEIFYGARAIGKNTTIDQNFQRHTKLETENGATLRYSLTDAGNVICTLYPAKSENRRPIEDSILFGFLKNPSDLWKRSKSHWKLFLSYMEVTCLDGNPSLIQRLRVIYLRNFKKYIIDNIVQVRKVTALLKEIAKYVLTIGVSGFLILFFTQVKDGFEEQKNEFRYNELQVSIAAISETASKISKQIERSELVLQELTKLEKLKIERVDNISNNLDGSRLLLEISVDELNKIRAALDAFSMKQFDRPIDEKTTFNAK